MSWGQQFPFDNGWRFALGNASDPALDFGCGTEYFNYWTKAASIHNRGPYSAEFDESAWPQQWSDVTLPHDWVVDLPFDGKASHSHGYKTVGPGYPETSVGWYRKVFDIPADYQGQSISLRFDGIFHSSQLWVNGFYLGREDDGYVSSEYDITQYLNYGGSNVVAVRADASQESGWFYEGAGIYRHVWLCKAPLVHIASDGVAVTFDGGANRVNVAIDIENGSLQAVCDIQYELTLVDAEGSYVAGASASVSGLLPYEQKHVDVSFLPIENPHLWDLDDPYLYTLIARVSAPGFEEHVTMVRTGLRTVEFTPDQGLLLNGRRVQIKGVNLHQDHAGAGSAIPDALYEYRLERLRSFGCNAIRTSHNPASPVLLDLCDSLGFLVLEENRLMGVNEYHRTHLERMIRRDINHPSIVAWSVGNEEWGIEWKDYGRRLTAVMREFCHRADPSRLMTVATSSGPVVVEPADIAGYNYVIQNDVDGLRAKWPERLSWGTEETTGCGTRGIYYKDPTGARMPAINRGPQGPDSLYNCIERGWQFYHSRPWAAGVFYWTGFDYRGESNPLVYPATGSSFGILDYCGFPKDEAYYLKSWWTAEPVLHLLPHWNLQGHEGENVKIWAYSNCDEVELFVNGKSLGRKKMTEDSHLEWDAIYKPGILKAVGYKNGKKVVTSTVRTAGAASAIEPQVFRRGDFAVVDLTLNDAKGNFAATSCDELQISVQGGSIYGVGNGDSGWKASERPAAGANQSQFSVQAFNGHAQILLTDLKPGATLTITLGNVKKEIKL